jgi:hypothetical protein
MGFQVGTGGERVAGSGDHGHAKRRVVTEVAPDVTQQLVGFDADGVLTSGRLRVMYATSPRFS